MLLGPVQVLVLSSPIPSRATCYAPEHACIGVPWGQGAEAQLCAWGNACVQASECALLVQTEDKRMNDGRYSSRGYRIVACLSEN